MRAWIATVLVGCTVGCTSEGSFELILTLPTTPELRPTGMTTVTVAMTSGDEPPITTTSVLEGGRFTAGELPVADDVKIEVLLHSVSNRLVGVGEARDLVDIVTGTATTVEMPVRRPFVYATSGTQLVSFDPTLESTDPMFQGSIPGISAPRFVVAVGSDRLAIVSTTQLVTIATDTNNVMGSPVALPSPARDAAAVPGTSKVAIATDTGISIVDLDTSTVQSAAVGPVDRVSVGIGPGGAKLAYGLVGRVTPALSPVKGCSGSSSLVTVDVEAPVVSAARPLPQPVSDLAAAPEAPLLFATLPCANKVVRVEDPVEGSAISFTDVAALERASVLAVAGDRLWAAGTRASKPHCVSTTGTVPCATDAPARCPNTGATPPNQIDYVPTGANLIVQSIPLAGGMPLTIDLPSRRETIFDNRDAAKQHAQVLRALGTVPLDLVVLPGGQYIGLVTTSNYYIQQLTNQGFIILPCLDATTSDWLLLDMASSSVAQRVRTSCSLIEGPSDSIFNDWRCDDPPTGEGSSFGEYTPISVGAMFGAR